MFLQNWRLSLVAIIMIPIASITAKKLGRRMGKVATESDVATAVCFLASDAASMITGTSIVIDGGWTAK